MTERQEIVLCCLLTCFGIGGIFVLKKKARDVSRSQVHGAPVVSQGESVDPRLAGNWGWKKIRLRAIAPPVVKKTIVAVIDTGCDIHHPELSGEIWTNPGETGLDRFGRSKENNAVDDDGNGFVDDVHGWNFSGHSADISDEHGHGTHIAGIIARAGEPARVDSADGSVKLMILKYFDVENQGLDNLRATIEAIQYAVRMGADIINYSAGGELRSLEEERVLQWAGQQGILVVAAAGNEGVNSDTNPFFPADYELSNIVSVTATDQNDRLLKASNYGTRTVQLAAPGKNIFSTLPNGQYGYMTGTSQATAFVTGVAAWLLARDRHLHDPAVMIQHLIETSAPRPALRAKLFSGGVLNAELAMRRLEMQDRSVSNIEAN